MATLSSIQNKIDGASRKYLLETRSIYKRITNVVTVNSLLEDPQSVDFTDVFLDPQPFYGRPERTDIGTLRAPADVLSADGTVELVNTEYILFCTPNCLSISDIQNPNLTVVFKDAQANEEIFRIIDYEPIGFQGGVAATQVLIRSFKKQTGTTNNTLGG